MIRRPVAGLITVPGLNKLMLRKHASNLALAEVAGVSVGCVERARRLGGRVKRHTREAILEALNKHEFQYAKRGPK